MTPFQIALTLILCFIAGTLLQDSRRLQQILKILKKAEALPPPIFKVPAVDYDLIDQKYRQQLQVVPPSGGIAHSPLASHDAINPR